jgi:hypothetical protein
MFKTLVQVDNWTEKGGSNSMIYAQIFQKSRSYLKILGAEIRHKFRTEDM